MPLDGATQLRPFANFRPFPLPGVCPGAPHHLSALVLFLIDIPFKRGTIYRRTQYREIVPCLCVIYKVSSV